MRFPDNQTTWRLGLAAIGVLGLLGSLVVVVIIWPKPWIEPGVPTVSNANAGHPESIPVTDDLHSVWTRLSFAAPPAATTATATDAPVREVRLVSLLTRKGQPTAAIETRPGRPLAFLNVGEERDGVRVVTIEEKSVEVIVDGTARRLEARR